MAEQLTSSHLLQLMGHYLMQQGVLLQKWPGDSLMIGASEGLHSVVGQSASIDLEYVRNSRCNCMLGSKA